MPSLRRLEQAVEYALSLGGETAPPSLVRSYCVGALDNGKDPVRLVLDAPCPLAIMQSEANRAHCVPDWDAKFGPLVKEGSGWAAKLRASPDPGRAKATLRKWGRGGS